MTTIDLNNICGDCKHKMTDKCGDCLRVAISDLVNTEYALPDLYEE